VHPRFVQLSALLDQREELAFAVRPCGLQVDALRCVLLTAGFRDVDE
jgi:hypothetical protein